MDKYSRGRKLVELSLQEQEKQKQVKSKDQGNKRSVSEMLSSGSVGSEDLDCTFSQKDITVTEILQNFGTVGPGPGDGDGNELLSDSTLEPLQFLESLFVGSNVTLGSSSQPATIGEFR